MPVVLKKLTNEPKNQTDEFGNKDKGEFEHFSYFILKDFKYIADFLGKIEMRQLFSK